MNLCELYVVEYENSFVFCESYQDALQQIEKLQQQGVKKAAIWRGNDLVYIRYIVKGDQVDS